MRTEQTWQERILPKKMKQLPPRIVSVLTNPALKQPNLPPLQDPTSRERCSIYLHGQTASGKTIQAACLLLEEEKRMYLQAEAGECLFVNVTELIQTLKQSFDKKDGETEQQIINHLRGCHLLVLDDIGTVKMSEWAFQVFYLIINYRYEHLLPTIFTSNYSLEQLEAALGDKRLTSRIERMCKILIKKTWRNVK